MKQKNTVILLLLVALCIAPVLQAQNIILRLQGGTDQTIALNTLRKITFSNNNMVLNYVAGDTKSYDFSSLDKMFFSPYTLLENPTAPKVDILFNVADNHVHFRNMTEGKQLVTVFRIDGGTVLKTTITNNESIDMSGFPSSIYLIRINNQVLKFKK